jgi:hypothetical protein
MLIGVGYKKQSGKDTLVKIINSTFPHAKIKRVAFADALKKEFWEIYLKPLGMPIEQIEDEAIKPRLRQGLQFHGQFKRTFCDLDYWIHRAHEQMQDENTIYIITDVRHINEADFVKNNGGLLIKVQRETGSNDQHPSEIELDSYNEWDYVIDNNGTYEEYEEKVINLFKAILVRS